MPKQSNQLARILLVDDNIRDLGGHYLEFAGLLADGARGLGYQPTLVTHQSFQKRNPGAAEDPRLKSVKLDCSFRVRRMEHWSLGVDGRSILARNREGTLNEGSLFQRLTQRVRDLSCRPSRHPTAMLERWSDSIIESVERFRPRVQDRIVINTGGDFQMLALADAAECLNQVGCLNLHVVFHFAVFEGQVDSRAIAFGRQVNAAVRRLRKHHVRLHATTETLAQQLTAVGVEASPIPYPTRARPLSSSAASVRNAPRVVLAGLPRAEKGRSEIKSLLQRIEADLIRQGRIRWSMQLPGKRWKRILPASMHDLYHAATKNQSAVEAAASPLEVLSGNLSCEAYHRWLDTADVGLFLYNPDRYAARCSGVLLEMLVRGIPAIVPANCWLAEKVQQLGDEGPVGWIYESFDQLPELLRTFERELEVVQENCLRKAVTVAGVHNGQNTLIRMGIADAQLSSQRIAG
jgi:hypothetical protein